MRWKAPGTWVTGPELVADESPSGPTSSKVVAVTLGQMSDGCAGPPQALALAPPCSLAAVHSRASGRSPEPSLGRCQPSRSHTSFGRWPRQEGAGQRQIGVRVRDMSEESHRECGPLAAVREPTDRPCHRPGPDSRGVARVRVASAHDARPTKIQTASQRVQYVPMNSDKSASPDTSRNISSQSHLAAPWMSRQYSSTYRTDPKRSSTSRFAFSMRSRLVPG